jgi:hypothetical protein
LEVDNGRVLRLCLFTFLAAVVVFCVVQDRVTADGASRYVSHQRAALASGGPTVTIDEVMEPAIRRSVEQGLLWGGGVVLVGLVAGVVTRRGRKHAVEAETRERRS